MRKYFSELDVLITKQRIWIGLFGEIKITLLFCSCLSII